MIERLQQSIEWLHKFKHDAVHTCSTSKAQEITNAIRQGCSLSRVIHRKREELHTIKNAGLMF
jgi:hypothetical protein